MVPDRREGGREGGREGEVYQRHAFDEAPVVVGAQKDVPSKIDLERGRDHKWVSHMFRPSHPHPFLLPSLPPPSLTYASSLPHSKPSASRAARRSGTFFAAMTPELREGGREGGRERRRDRWHVNE